MTVLEIHNKFRIIDKACHHLLLEIKEEMKNVKEYANQLFDVFVKGVSE